MVVFNSIRLEFTDLDEIIISSKDFGFIKTFNINENLDTINAYLDSLIDYDKVVTGKSGSASIFLEIETMENIFDSFCPIDVSKPEFIPRTITEIIEHIRDFDDMDIVLSFVEEYCGELSNLETANSCAYDAYFGEFTCDEEAIKSFLSEYYNATPELLSVIEGYLDKERFMSDYLTENRKYYFFNS